MLDFALIATAPLIVAVPSWLPIPIAVPPACALVGADVSVQGVSYDGSVFAGANALDLVIGSH